MAREHRKECPDCNGIDHYSLIWGKGNGRCSSCEGEGGGIDPITGIAAPLLDLDPYEQCKICSGTGQCQTCGGTGFVYYDEENNYTESESETDYSSLSSSSDHYSKPSDYYSSAGDSDDTGCGAVIGLIALIAICILIFRSCNTTEDQNYSVQQYAPKEQPQEQAAQPQINACEANSTGDFTFENTTERTIYVQINPSPSDPSEESIEVGPHKTVTKYGMSARKVHYTYNYYNSDGLNLTFLEGDFTVEKCKSDSMKLYEIPNSYKYIIPAYTWQEISIPPECCYVAVSFGNYFSIRFFENDNEHLAGYWSIIPEGTTKIYLKSNYSNGQVINIEKFR